MSKLNEYLEAALIQQTLDNDVEIDMNGQGDLFTWNQDKDIKRIRAEVKKNKDDEIQPDDSIGVKTLKFIKQAGDQGVRYVDIQRFLEKDSGDTQSKNTGTMMLARLLPLHCKKVKGKWQLRNSTVPSQPFSNKWWKAIGFKDWDQYRLAWAFGNTKKKREHEKVMGTYEKNEAQREKWRNQSHRPDLIGTTGKV